MSIDRYYKRIGGKWVKLHFRVLMKGGVLDPEANDELCTEFWVDIAHGGNNLIDERYYFDDLDSALDFYQHGWEGRQFLDDNDEPVGLDHSGLYAHGKLIDGCDIYGDPIGHEGERLRLICDAVAREIEKQGVTDIDLPNKSEGET